MRIRRFAAAAGLLLWLFALPAAAASGTITDDFSLSGLRPAIPEEVLEELPEDIFSQRGTAAAESVAVSLDIPGILAFLTKTLTAALPTALSQLSLTVGIVLLSSLFGILREALASEAVSEAVRLAVGLALVLTLFATQQALFEAVYGFLSRLTALMTGLLPVMGTIYAMGGNVGTAVVQSSTTMFFLALCENAAMYVLMPMLRVCFGFTLVTAVSGGVRLESISKTLKNVYTGALGLLMLVLVTVMATRSMIAAGADTLATRTVKLAVGSMIPVVGGAISDSLGTVASGLSLIKNAAGALGIVVILLMTLPTLLSLLLNRLALTFSSLVAGLLGCESERKILDEIRELSGFALGLCSMCALLFIFTIIIFVSTNLAIGGSV